MPSRIMCVLGAAASCALVVTATMLAFALGASVDDASTLISSWPTPCSWSRLCGIAFRRGSRALGDGLASGFPVAFLVLCAREMARGRGLTGAGRYRNTPPGARQRSMRPDLLMDNPSI